MITSDQYQIIEQIFSFYNKRLFADMLNPVLFTFARKNKVAGYFSARSWVRRNERSNEIHEIAINPDYTNLDDNDFHQTLVHEMCHLWQEDFGIPSRRSYHNKEWAQKMKECGLIPINIDNPSRETGQNITDELEVGGVLDCLIQELKESVLFMPLQQKVNLKYQMANYEGTKKSPFQESLKESEQSEIIKEMPIKSGIKFKYTCDCSNIWGKFGLSVNCNNCGNIFKIVD